jgi:hypothetical protein
MRFKSNRCRTTLSFSFCAVIFITAMSNHAQAASPQYAAGGGAVWLEWDAPAPCAPATTDCSTFASVDGWRVYIDGARIGDLPSAITSFDVTAYVADSRSHVFGVQAVHLPGLSNETVSDVVTTAWAGAAKVPTTCSADQWLVTYYGNTTLGGTPIAVYCQTKLTDDFGYGGVNGVRDHFSFLATKNVTFAAGQTVIEACADDGIRVVVAGRTIIDGWFDHKNLCFSGAMLTDGSTYTVMVQYYQNVEYAQADVHWVTTALPGNPVSTPPSSSWLGATTEVPPNANPIVDASGAVWTIGEGGKILRDNTWAEGGTGSKILSLNGTIVVFGTDGNWWRWMGSGWSNLGPDQPR